MPIYHANVLVVSRRNVLHPESKTVQEALHTLGFQDVEQLEIGKHFSFQLDALNAEEAEAKIKRMSEQLLSNPVIEETHILSLKLQESSE